MSNTEIEATNAETLRHIGQVRLLLDQVIVELLRRGREHDKSKMSPEEVDVFTEFTPKLKDCTYGSDEYKGYLAAMKPALDHHYANNAHHPEHFDNGIEDMSLIDLIEMICDWKAASLRHANGDISRSIQVNTERFGIDPTLRRILENTVRDLNL